MRPMNVWRHKTLFSFHGVSWGFPGAAKREATQIEEIRSNLMEAEKKIAKILSIRLQAERRKTSESYLLRRETKDVRLRPKRDHNRQRPSIPGDAPFITLNVG